MVCFQVNLDDDFIKKAIDISESKNIQLVLLGDKYVHPNIIPIPFPSVEAWVTIIKNASFVFTDSFHGLAFSLNFNREFLMYNSNPIRFTRIDSLLRKFELKDRIMKANSESIANIESIDYIKVNNLLKKYKQESIHFLDTNLA